MSPPETHIDVLAVFSHPDDAELSVAGTLLKLKALGYRTGVCDLTRGEMGTRGTPEIRAKEALDAAIASESTGGFTEQFEQLDELLVTLGVSN